MWKIGGQFFNIANENQGIAEDKTCEDWKFLISTFEKKTNKLVFQNKKITKTNDFYIYLKKLTVLDMFYTVRNANYSEMVFLI